MTSLNLTYDGTGKEDQEEPEWLGIVKEVLYLEHTCSHPHKNKINFSGDGLKAIYESEPDDRRIAKY